LQQENAQKRTSARQTLDCGPVYVCVFLEEEPDAQPVTDTPAQDDEGASDQE
jgi:hypothetical protein